MNDLDLNIGLPLKSGFVVAVSGGVDSMVLLDLLIKHQYKNIVVAHFDHGIREGSQQDRIFVQEYCMSHNIKFVYDTGKLGTSASEEKARNARYNFLRRVLNDYNYSAILTAHHEDDILETAIINLIRGTGRHGLGSLKSTSTIVRPLLNYSKKQILDYAKQNNLKWQEDSTNSDIRYLRNYVRLTLLPFVTRLYPDFKSEMVQIINHQQKLNGQIDKLRSEYVDDNFRFESKKAFIKRYDLIILPAPVAIEMLQQVVLQITSYQLQKKQAELALLFIKTAHPNKIHQINNDLQIVSKLKEVIVEPRVS